MCQYYTQVRLLYILYDVDLHASQLQQFFEMGIASYRILNKEITSKFYRGKCLGSPVTGYSSDYKYARFLHSDQKLFLLKSERAPNPNCTVCLQNDVSIYKCKVASRLTMLNIVWSREVHRFKIKEEAIAMFIIYFLGS